MIMVGFNGSVQEQQMSNNHMQQGIESFQEKHDLKPQIPNQHLFKGKIQR